MISAVLSIVIVNIAYKLYGTGTLYTKLAEANKLADPYIIYIGQILTVPAK